MKKFEDMTEIEAAEHYGNLGAANALGRLAQELLAKAEIPRGESNLEMGNIFGLRWAAEIAAEQSFLIVESTLTNETEQEAI